MGKSTFCIGLFSLLMIYIYILRSPPQSCFTFYCQALFIKYANGCILTTFLKTSFQFFCLFCYLLLDLLAAFNCWFYWILNYPMLYKIKQNSIKKYLIFKSYLANVHTVLFPTGDVKLQKWLKLKKHCKVDHPIAIFAVFWSCSNLLKKNVPNVNMCIFKFHEIWELMVGSKTKDSIHFALLLTQSFSEHKSY